MISVMGAITLTFLAVAMVAALIVSGVRSAAGRLRASLLAGAWFAAVLALSGFGVYSKTAGVGLPAFALSLLVPVLAGIIAMSRSRSVREAVRSIPTPLLVSLHAGRVLGVFFLLLLAAKQLPPTFASSAGWGDIAIGILALPVAWAIQRRARGWWWTALIWNIFAMGDLLSAVTLGVGSIANSPLHFVFESPSSIGVTMLPWALIPAYIVPLYLLTNLVIFARLAEAARVEHHSGHGALREVPAR